jgi:hypothetical protein
VSPDHTQAVALRQVEASAHEGVLINLATGELTWQDGCGDWDKSRGWEVIVWHTSLEPMSRDRLYEEMRSHDQAHCELAMQELELRDFTLDDVPPLLDLLADPKALDDARHAAAFRLYKLQPKDDATLAKVAAVAVSDSSMKARLSAAWVLSKLAPDCGGEVDVVGGYHDERLRDREIARMVAWWKSRQAATTIPSKQ